MIKKIIRSALNSVGYTIVKINRPDPKGFSIVKVGEFDVKINNQSGLKYCYEHCPDYGAQLTRLTRALLRHFPELEVIDVGANQGDSAALIKSGGDVPIISVEGDATLLSQYKDNTRQFSGITLQETFLSDQVSEVNCVYENVGHNLTILPANGDGGIATRFSTIDRLYEEAALNKRCKLLKVDTEGFDLKVIRGSVKFLNEVAPVILFELNRENLASVERDPFSIFAWLTESGYQTVIFYESDGRFMYSATLDNVQLMRQMFEYTDGVNAKIRYLDMVVFHKSDKALAEEFIKEEEDHRAGR